MALQQGLHRGTGHAAAVGGRRNGGGVGRTPVVQALLQSIGWLLLVRKLLLLLLLARRLLLLPETRVSWVLRLEAGHEGRVAVGGPAGLQAGHAVHGPGAVAARHAALHAPRKGQHHQRRRHTTWWQTASAVFRAGRLRAQPASRDSSLPWCPVLLRTLRIAPQGLQSSVQGFSTLGCFGIGPGP